MTEKRQFLTDTPLVIYQHSIPQLVRDLDLVWYGYRKERPAENDLWWFSQEAVDLAEALVEKINSVAPEGYFFGSHPEQPECLGFWVKDCF